jgi:hypothetical protein
MKKRKRNVESVVQTDREEQKPEKNNLSLVLRHDKGYSKVEKLWLVQYFTTRRHSRTLYLPLDPLTVRLHDIQKGDIIKAVILELRKAPRPDEPIRELEEKEIDEEGEL